jgi:hypothetical protein
MKQIAEKLRDLEKRLSAKKGEFSLFALFLREDAPDVWDLVVSADWIEKDQPAALQDIAKQVQKTLGPDEITKVSRVVIIDKANPALSAVSSVIAIEHGLAEVANNNFFGMAIKQGYIITAQRRRAA